MAAFFYAQKKRPESRFSLSIGRGERIRTFDPYNPIVVRYQTAPRPDTLLPVSISQEAAAWYMKRGWGKRGWWGESRSAELMGQAYGRACGRLWKELAVSGADPSYNNLLSCPAHKKTPEGAFLKHYVIKT